MSTSTETLPNSGAAMIEGVCELLPKLSERAEDAERERRVPAESIAELRETGYLRSFVPAAFGGLELYPAAAHAATRMIATVCPSTAWAAQLLMTHSHAIPYYDEQLQREFFEDGPDTLISSSVAPMGRGVPVDGGIRLSGRWSWSSGADHATWATVGFQMPDGDGLLSARLAVLAPGEYRIEDTWFASGLKGSGSQDLVVEDVFVPDYRHENSLGLNFGQSRGYGSNPGGLYKLPLQAVFSAGFPTVALGAAEGMLAHCAARVKTRVRAYTGTKAAESGPALLRIGEATEIIRAAAALLESNWASIEARGRSGEPATFEEFIEWRGDQAYVTRLCKQAADHLYTGAGGSAALDKSPIQRLWRDIHAGGMHAYNDFDIAGQVVGRKVIGLDPDLQLF